MHNWELLSSNRFRHKTQVVAMNHPHIRNSHIGFVFISLLAACSKYLRAASLSMRRAFSLDIDRRLG